MPCLYKCSYQLLQFLPDLNHSSSVELAISRRASRLATIWYKPQYPILNIHKYFRSKNTLICLIAN